MPGYHKLRLPQQYRIMLDLDASGFAWEWLRRNPDFRSLWASAGAAARRASAQAAVAAGRVTTAVTELGQHPLAERMVQWGLTFAPYPDAPATDHPLIGWLPELHVETLSIVRPLPWARAVAGLRFTPDRWGPGVFRIGAPGGTHLLVRRHGSPEMALWLPTGLSPGVGESFGLYLHADRQHAARIRAASLLARAIVNRPPLYPVRYPQAHRQTAMLCIHDLTCKGASLREIGVMLLNPAADDWRTSSERSDLRRLADAGAQMVAGGYRSLLQAKHASRAGQADPA